MWRRSIDKKRTFDKKRLLKDLNTIIFLISIFVYPLWLNCCVSTFWISFIPLIGVIRCMRAIGRMYENLGGIEDSRKNLIKLNGVLLLWIALLHIPGMVLFYFSDTKCMYRIKRLDYIHGVYGYIGKYVEENKKILPEKLPDKCEDYSYLTAGILTPYHAPSCLMFRTDEDTIDSYAEYYGSLCDEIMVKNDEIGEAEKELDQFLEQGHIFEESRRREFDNADLYWIEGHFPRGALLDKDSGYVVILS